MAHTTCGSEEGDPATRRNREKKPQRGGRPWGWGLGGQGRSLWIDLRMSRGFLCAKKSPFARGYLSQQCKFLSVSVFHCRRVVCACSAGAPLVHSQINHFRQKESIQKNISVREIPAPPVGCEKPEKTPHSRLPTPHNAGIKTAMLRDRACQLSRGARAQCG
jgi:hypothetical protein